MFSTLHTWGWITIILGVIELTASFSLFAGNAYGRVVGIFAASIGAIGALLNVGGGHPWWSLGVFAVCLICIKGLAVLGEPETSEQGWPEYGVGARMSVSPRPPHRASTARSRWERAVHSWPESRLRVTSQPMESGAGPYGRAMSSWRAMCSHISASASVISSPLRSTVTL